MEKDFDNWNKLKKGIERIQKKEIGNLYFHEREIWWTSLGLNIGHEQDGKNINYERPVLIIRKFNEHVCWIVPLTSKSKVNAKYYHKLQNNLTDESDSVAIISQIKLISTKRLLRKIGNVTQSDFKEIVSKIKNLLPNL